MAEKLRKELCAEQVLFCTNVCGGEGFTREAFCNTNTLGSKCACSNGAEAAIRRYQWPVFQRVCEAQRAECRMGCDHSNVANGDKSACFNSCDARMACGTEHAPELKVMVQNFDDPTSGSPKPIIKVTTSAPKAPADESATEQKDVKGKKDQKGDSKKKNSPLPTGSSSGASYSAAGAMSVAALAVVAGSLF
ncbi:hypothetical protein IWW36_000564 [Coemansia brasiliensis]|uniref:DUF7707 domain-containing protein n=1 Tax=Coemansia brasiliensis TaxID=2650707 RepID=A0A9W8IHB4_9FUNG|nr:hypothetical protein IWW36_000564 [Coemansia brasiliensis]